jgi:hypothetical protein
MSASARRKIAAAQRPRWARVRAAKKHSAPGKSENSPKWLACNPYGPRVQQIFDHPAAFQGGSMLRLGIKLYWEALMGTTSRPLAIEGLILEILTEIRDATLIRLDRPEIAGAGKGVTATAP